MIALHFCEVASLVVGVRPYISCSYATCSRGPRQHQEAHLAACTARLHELLAAILRSCQAAALKGVGGGGSGAGGLGPDDGEEEGEEAGDGDGGAAGAACLVKG